MSKPAPKPDPKASKNPKHDALLLKLQPAIIEQHRTMLRRRGPPAYMMVVHIRSFFGEILARRDSDFAAFAQTTSKEDHCWIAMGLTLGEFLPMWARASTAEKPVLFGQLGFRKFVEEAGPDELVMVVMDEEKPNLSVFTVNRAAYL